MKAVAVVASLLTTQSSVSAFAQKVSTPVAPTAEPNSEESASTDGDFTPFEASPAEMRRTADASVDRNILAPTAETQPSGEVTFNSYELVLAGVSYGVTNDFQLSATTLLPIVESIPVVFVASGKVRLLHGPRGILSVQPTLVYVNDEGDSVWLMGLNVMCDHILDRNGYATLTFGLGSLGVLGPSDGNVDLGDGVLFGASGGVSGRVAKIVKLLGEVMVPAVVDNHGFEFADSVLFNYGARFFSQSIAVDLTFIRPIGEDLDEFVMGLPFVTFSARF